MQKIIIILLLLGVTSIELYSKTNEYSPDKYVVTIETQHDSFPIPICKPMYSRDEIIRARSLKELNSFLRKKVKTPEIVKQVIIFNVQIDTIPVAIKQFVNLEEFSCIDCSINKFPLWFSSLKKLKRITLKAIPKKESIMDHIPYSIEENQNLEELIIVGSKFTQLPQGLENLKKLVKLDLSNNKIKSIPSSFQISSSLKRISLAGNELTTFKSIFPRNSKLVYLNISHNKITRVEDFFQDIEFLKYFICSNNPLNNLPSNICMLQNLISLSAAEIEMNSVPDCVGEISSLRIVDFSRNKLKTLPESFNKHENLFDLNLMQNSIIELPFDVEDMLNLHKLHLRNSHLPDSILLDIQNEIGKRKVAKICYGISPIGGIILSSENSIAVLKKAGFKGGYKAKREAFIQLFEYPNWAREKNINSRVSILGEIDESGHPINLKIIKSPGGGCGTAFLKVIKNLTNNWEPAIGVDGNPVKVAYVFHHDCEEKE